ncbi:chloride channel protein [Sneathiella litorea]|uniref:Chloride channel protein n=1 Tax=Sneathiella litorea TaxID=2606216 RepID=A0A6L8W7M8_9PROT|nr:chloride channel protein [Sneathiella litorea]MZR30247.1 chloride channel protein [Sneathiella litorea]
MPETENRSLVLLCLLAIFVGVIGGIGAWVFRLLIGLFHNLLFLGKFSLQYDASIHTPTDVWGAWVILVPVIGAVGVAWLVKTFAPEAKGHGVPEVMDAIYYNEGQIRPVVVIVKSLASALSIGSGGAIGREGPIIQIGATFGSLIGNWVAMPTRQRVILVAAGAGAGIAATFNAPLGGILFAVELLLVSISAESIFLLATSSIMATYIGRQLLSMTPSFNVPALEIPDFGVGANWGLILFLPFGLICGVAATFFVRAIYWAEDKFDAIPGNYYSRHMLGMAIVGVMIYVMQLYAGHFYIQGVGYATILDVLMNALSDPWFLLLLFALKMIATCLTLGSGASGGVFSPSLFMGATLGAAFGNVMHMIFPGLEVGITVFAISGMAAMIGSTTGAVFTSVVMLAEMTGDHNTVLPTVLTTAVAYALRRYLSPASIYTLKLNRRGHAVPEGMTSAFLAAKEIKDIMAHNFTALPKGETPPNSPGVVIWTGNGNVLSVERRFVDKNRAEEALSVGIAERHLIVPEAMGLVEVLQKLQQRQAEIALVSAAPNTKIAADIVGVVTVTEISNALKDAAILQ